MILPTPDPALMAWLAETKGMVIPLAPMSAARPRFNRYKVGTHKPPAQKKWEHTAVQVLRARWPFPPLDGPIRAHVSLVLPRPKCRTSSAHGGTMPRAKMARLQERLGIEAEDRLPAWSDRKDVDNMAKLVLDCATKAGVWVDDNKVCSLAIDKMWAAIGEQPHVRLEVWPWG